MEKIIIKDFTFKYPNSHFNNLNNINLKVEKGDFLLICGQSGSGKSTLLKHLKSAIAPAGQTQGEIYFENKILNTISLKEQAEQIGFIYQNPDNQIVTDKVWHELAFGLENLAYDNSIIKSRIAEMASFFGIEKWFHKNITELSGGQKQILNLASVMVMQPSLLILDEPTGQLDPIASLDFINMLKKLNDDLGITIIVAEHKLEEFIPVVNKVLVLDNGEIILKSNSCELGKKVKALKHPIFTAMPTPIQIWASIENEFECPLNINQARTWLENVLAQKEINHPNIELEKDIPLGQAVLEASGVYFKYDKDLPDLIKNFNLILKEGDFIALMGGNGVGKSTILNLLLGVIRPYRGQIKKNAKIALLPQSPEALFLKNTVKEDLLEVLDDKTQIDKNKLERVINLCQINDFLDRHPYDLSGGEKQRLALAKILLIEPQILLLDEPTKGFDANFKKIFAKILKKLLEEKVSILMVSHDIEFCAEFPNKVALLFDGSIVSEASPKIFFQNHTFYTTAANRIAKNLLDDVVLPMDIIKQISTNIPNNEVLVEKRPLPKKPINLTKTPKKPPLIKYKKIITYIFAFITMFLLIKITSITDLSKIISLEGMTPLAGSHFKIYILFIIAFLIFSFLLAKKGEKKPKTSNKNIRNFQKKRLTKKEFLTILIFVLAIPLTILIGNYYFESRKYYFISLLILFQTMIPFFLLFEEKKPGINELVLISVLSAIAVAGRAMFFMVPQFKPVIAITIISAISFGGQIGFLVGSMSMFLSNMLFSQGPWTPWQMFAMGLIGFLAGLIFKNGFLAKEKLNICIFGFFSAIIIYGGIMNPASALIWLDTINFEIILSYYLTGLPFDIVHAVATWIFLWIAAEPMLEKLDRVKYKYDFK